MCYALKLKLSDQTLSVALFRNCQKWVTLARQSRPGWVKIDMGGSSAPRTPELGADTVIWLATETSHKETGKFWRDHQEISF